MSIFNDPIHGNIELHPLLVKMIDTPQFQRLRYIKQLGTKHLVYPGATHTRFEHSLGVAHLAGCLLKTLHENQPELNINKKDFLCVQIAALCHDMGHGPFSHLFDGMFIPEVLPGEPWEHEQASVRMFCCMIENNELDEQMKFYGLDLQEDIKFIKELILKGQKDGQVKCWSMEGRAEDKSFLYEIVANKVNGIDVDKWDYLARDCYYLGIPCGFDSQRLLKSARVCEVNRRKHVCFRDKVADNIYGMFHTRYTLHRQALQHKIGYIIDVKIKDALVKANNELITSPPSKISDVIYDMPEYTKLTDHIFDQILNQSDSNPDLAEARSILQDVVNRRLPKFVGEARLNENKLKEKLTNHWEEKVNNHSLDPEDKIFCKIQNDSLKAQPVKAFKIQVYKKTLLIQVLEMGFGEVGKEPIANVHFYSKSDLKTAFKMKKYQVSSLKPEKFHEFLLRVYHDPEDQKHQKEVQQKAQKYFHEWCKNPQNEFIDCSYSHSGWSDSPDKHIFKGKHDDKDADEEEENQETSSSKIFNDPIHGQIKLHPLLVKIIDTPQFQRLRHIKQLGGTYLVYPGATHTRFEHSVG
ncbi:deoxynucleoside triphosphate triphosphohydrolase SAMHD1-like [Carassius carassius]|uniref:deoxynucleoside triphosphate triphosphohydrolase SAMHD1-like n=1 Tax=Carassius carassius TaxID=217509 RepID=UPI0028684CF5|nr:deoxynucleoside triphosphate triphosphohydrolase SAMHD1-like [Carassius carassius]XP_059411057.1 deoxynucleoside triphosphate triphosphohydrolase SAMHD1-like [Carassius carassius]